MKVSWTVPITLCMFCYLFVTVTSATINRSNVELELSRQYPDLYRYLLGTFAEEPTTQYKRGCSNNFSGCAHMKLASAVLKQNNRGEQLYKFGSSGPGKRSFPELESIEKRRMGGCGDYFSGCASLKAGRDLVRAMLRQPSKFGSGGPGKK